MGLHLRVQETGRALFTGMEHAPEEKQQDPGRRGREKYGGKGGNGLIDSYFCKIHGLGDTAPKSTVENNHVQVKIQFSLGIIDEPYLLIVQQDEENCLLHPRRSCGEVKATAPWEKAASTAHPTLGSRSVGAPSRPPPGSSSGQHRGLRFVRVPLSNQDRKQLLYKELILVLQPWQHLLNSLCSQLPFLKITSETFCSRARLLGAPARSSLSSSATSKAAVNTP